MFTSAMCLHRTWQGIPYFHQSASAMATASLTTTKCTLSHEVVIQERDTAVKVLSPPGCQMYLKQQSMEYHRYWYLVNVFCCRGLKSCTGVRCFDWTQTNRKDWGKWKTGVNTGANSSTPWQTLFTNIMSKPNIQNNTMMKKLWKFYTFTH